jgi:ABC-2 type transport system permease protein
MRAFLKIVQTEFRLISREPTNLMFILLLPAAMAWIMGSNAPAGDTTNLIIMMLGLSPMLFGLMTFPMLLVGYRERGMLRRLKITPLSPALYLVAQAFVGLLLVLVGGALVLGIGVGFFNIGLPRHPALLLGVFIIGTLSFIAIGALIGSVTSSSRTTQVVSVVVFGGMMVAMLLGGSSDSLTGILSQWLPTHHFSQLVQSFWVGSGAIIWSSILLLVGVSLAGFAGAAKLFRWE